MTKSTIAREILSEGSCTHSKKSDNSLYCTNRTSLENSFYATRAGIYTRFMEATRRWWNVMENDGKQWKATERNCYSSFDLSSIYEVISDLNATRPLM